MVGIYDALASAYAEAGQYRELNTSTTALALAERTEGRQSLEYALLVASTAVLATQIHLVQTEGHIERLKKAFELLGKKAQPKPCKAMMGPIEEGKETMEEGAENDPLVADIALVASAERVEHYEIAGYGNVRGLARLLGEIEVAHL